MKHIYSLIIVVVSLAAGCVPTFDEEADPADVPAILSVVAGNEDGIIPQTNAIYPEVFVDTVFIQDETVDFSNMYIRASLETGCIIEPLEGAPKCGTYGDFSTPLKYRVTAPSGKTADWTIVLD
jgi:hypothetical protein